MKYRLYLIAMSLLLCACQENNCTMENSVVCRYSLLDSETGMESPLQDTLSIFTTKGKRIINRAINTSELQLPMSHTLPCDTLLLHFTSETAQATDTIIVSKTNIPHFESLECGTSYFHEISNISLKPRKNPVDGLTTLDSVRIVNTHINYDQVTNLHLYHHTGH